MNHTKESVASKVTTIVNEQLGVTDAKPESNLVGDLGADSLDCVELCMAIEDEFGIELTDDDAEKCKTVQDAIDLTTRTLGL